MNKRVLFLLLLCVFNQAQSRESGHYVPGVAYNMDFVVPAKAGFYYEQYNMYYTTDTYRDEKGKAIDSLTIGDKTTEIDTDIDVYSIASVFMWVTDKKIFGGTYAFYVSPSLARSSSAATLSSFNNSLSFNTDNTGLGDLLIEPVYLGWSGKRYDFSAGLSVYVPIGEYKSDADDNIGLGFWTGQMQGAGYYYFDDDKSSAVMLAGTYEVHGEKDGTDITPGDHFTLEYNYTKYLTPKLAVGVAGYSQWQVEGDSGGSPVLDPGVKTEVHGYGAEISYSFTPRLNMLFKYMQEYDSQARFEGQWFMVNLFYSPSP